METGRNLLDNKPEHRLDALRSMALFVAVAESGSFTAAAKLLGVPTSTLSWRIGELEQSLGLRLFNRSTRRISLTSEGAQHFERCKRLVDEAHTLVGDMRAHSSAPAGRIRLSTTSEFASLVLAHVLPRFFRRFPDISLDIDTAPNRVDFTSLNLDLVIRMGPLEDSTLVARRLMETHINLFASPDYLAQFGAPATPEELPKHQCIKVGPDPGESTWTLKRDNREAVIRHLPRYFTNNMGVARELVLNGLGIGKLVEELYLKDIREGRLVRVLPAWEGSTVPVSAVLAQREVPARTKAFVDFLLEAFAPYRAT